VHRLLLACSLTWVCLVVLAPEAHTQPRVPARPVVPSSATLSLLFERDGSVNAHLVLSGVDGADGSLDALEESLGCPLETVSATGNLWYWFLHARGRGALRGQGWTKEGDLRLDPLLDFLHQRGVVRLDLGVSYPECTFSRCGESIQVSFRSDRQGYQVSWPTSQAPAEPLALAFGYRLQDAWRFAPLAGCLLAALGLTVWRRWGALRAPPEARYRTWFRYWQFDRRLTMWLWCIWLVLFGTLGVLPLLRFLLADHFPTHGLLAAAIVGSLPLLLVLLACKLLSAPVFALVPEVGWTRSRLVQQIVWGPLVWLAALLLIVGSFDTPGRPDWRTMWLPGLGGLGLLVFSLIGWVSAHGARQQTLAGGAVRDRLMELAEQAQVKARLVYVLPPPQWRLLNAVGVPGEVVFVCPEALPHLSQRETNALLALELARLWRLRGSSLIGFLKVMGLILVGGVLTGLAMAFLGGFEFGPLFLLIIFPVLLHGLLRRWPHFSARLDGPALSITGDPEALLTGLARLRRLDLLPLAPGEEKDEALPPTADWPRLARLAERAGIPPERLDEILAGSGSGTERYAPLEGAGLPDEAVDQRAFSTVFKKRQFFRQVWLPLFVGLLLPALAAWLAGRAHLTMGWALAAVYLAGLLAALTLPRRLARWLACRGSRELRRLVRQKFDKEGLPLESWGALFVGLAPAPKPQSYEDFINWDVGYLVLAGDRLCYLGDRTRFALPREQIEETTLGPGAPRWGAPPHVYVRWRDEATGTTRVFQLTHDHRPAGQRREDSRALARRLRDWLTGPPGDVPPAPLQELPPPHLPEKAGKPLGLVLLPAVLFSTVLLRLGLAVIPCLVLGLGFDAAGNWAGWYVLGVALAAFVADILPYVRYRERAVESPRND
jgi:hypothetical protein